MHMMFYKGWTIVNEILEYEYNGHKTISELADCNQLLAFTPGVCVSSVLTIHTNIMNHLPAGHYNH